MSKIEVDAIDKQSGSTLTIGGSGTTVQLGTGASQTGFGREGSVNWQTGSIKTGNFTAANGEGYFINSSGSITANLPAGSAGAIVAFSDYARNFATHNFIISPNGSEKIGGIAADLTLNVDGQALTLVYVDSTKGWVNVQNAEDTEQSQSFITATVSGTGNTLVTAPDCANVKIATFTGPGTFCVSTASTTAPENIVSYLIVGGGAGGGNNDGGGGGGGGYREVDNPVTPYTSSPLQGFCTPANRITLAAQAYPIVVGGGGALGPPSTPGGVGIASSFGGITAAGGGFGRSECSPTSPADNRKGGPGGSGGGGGTGGGTPGAGGDGNTPPTSPPQGQPGGSGPGAAAPITPPQRAGGGGGGAGGNGGSGSFGNAGGGGAGTTTQITSSPLTFSGGGGGGGRSSGGSANPVGRAGAGTGTSGTAGSGSDNSGGGGGGGGEGSSTAGAGGSGIVVIRYKFQ
mgnify:FL=1